eukprot:gene2328-2796_t
MPKPLCVITGASSGIGMQLAKDLSAQGHALLLISRRVEIMEKLNLPDCLCESVDVTDLETYKKAVEKAEAKFGPTDLLINNAGIMFIEQFAKQKPENFKKSFDVNVLGVLNGTHLVLEGMIQRKKGTIINISSIAGLKAFPNHSTYCGTKAAVCLFTEALREEVASTGVRVSVVCPGVVDTDLLSVNPKEVIDGYNSWKNTLGKVLESKDVSDSCLFIYNAPQHCCIREIDLAPTGQPA